MKRFNDIRSLTKVPTSGGLPKETAVRQSSLEDVARELESVAGVDGGSFSGESTRARLEPVMTPWINEGFFAEAVLLVEGLEDRSAILGRVKARDIDLGSRGVAVLPCNGKTKMDRPSIIFEELGKPVYMMFDADYDDDDEVETNRLLLRLAGVQEVEDWPSGVYESHACFHRNLTEAVKDSVGTEFYEETLGEVCDEFGYNKTTRGAKNPTVMSEFFAIAENDGRTVSEIDEVIDKVISLP